MSNAPSSAGVTAPPPSDEVQKLVLPLDDYIFSNAEYAMTSNALDLMVRDCMKEQGLAWRSVKRPTDLPNMWNRRRYGLIEIDVARRLGYHATPELLSPNVGARMEERRDAELTPRQFQAANNPKTGCNKKADDLLWDGTKPDLRQLNSLSAQGLAQSQKAPAVQKSLRQWRSCMKDRGFHYGNPTSAISDKAWSNTRRPSHKEIKTAIADVRCKDQSHLIAAWSTEEAKIQKAYIQKHRTYFADLKSSKDRYLNNARLTLKPGYR
ncbi:hypothetical protein ACQB60_34240 [Actinomycetota bacterium Odt1-20B]